MKMPFSSELTQIGEKGLFKIFGFDEFSFERAFAASKVDWSGFYTQLTAEHSLRYLTKKWDDGAQYACLVHLKPNPELKLLTLQSVGLADGKISGEEKASAIKEYLKEKYEIAIEGNLVCELGKRGIVLGCVDADDPEIIIAHEILNEENFKFRTLLRFKKSSDGMLRTLGWQSGSQHSCEHPFNPVKGQSQFEPYLLLHEPDIISTIKQLSF